MNNFRLSDLVDLTAVQKMAEANYQVAGMPIGIIDAFDGSILVGVGWQDICVKFHRANKETLKRCQISDSYIKDHLAEGRPCHYKCLNGLWDIGIPIVVAGRHLATLFLGQFFYEDEKPDREFFIRQAYTFAFNINEYLAAFERVPVLSRQKVEYILQYNSALSSFLVDLAEHSLSKITAQEELRESEERFRSLFMNAPLPYQSLDENGNFLEVNQAFLDVLGYSREDLIGRNFGDILHPDWVDHFKENFPRFKAVGEVMGVEFEIIKKDGSIILVVFNGKIHRDDQGRFQRTHCIFHKPFSKKDLDAANTASGG